jgi:1-acyl-sn-glycerol-3-phosphate acyltransferase
VTEQLAGILRRVKRPSLSQTYPGQSLPSILLYASIRNAAALAYTLVYRVRVFGVQNVPASGPCLIASNHQSHLDPPLISSSILHRATHFVAKADLFKFGPFAWLIRNLNSIPVRQDGSADMGAIREILARLSIGAPVLIFPEGSRTLDGRLAPFQRGVALLVKKAGCPVVPCAVEGCRDAFPRGEAFPKFWGRRLAVAFGKPIPHDELLKDGAEAALLRLAREVETLRLELRAKLRASSAGRFPPAGAGDERAEPRTA